MARQPIYDANLAVHAYELLFRRGETGSAGEIDAEAAAKSLVNSLVDIGLRDLIGDSTAFVNVSYDLLMSNSIVTLPKEQVVIEVLETIEPTTEVLERLSQLQTFGYRLALDDFVLSPETRILLRYASIVKFDVLNKPESEVRRQAALLRRPGVKLLAEKVEDEAMFKVCQRAGFELFQGYYFSKPELLKRTSVETNKFSLLRLASKIQSSDAQYAEIEEIIASDVSLSYRLLKFVSSAQFGVGCKITSIRQALMFLGISTVSALATLLAMAGTSGKPSELMTIALVRGKMCEVLATTRNLPNPDRYFTVGLLSVLDALLDAPMEVVLAELPLAPEINEALLLPDCENDLAKALRSALAYENGDWESPRPEGVTNQDLSNAYHAAICWATEANTQLAAA